MSSKFKQVSRREFLAHSGKAAVALAAAGTLASCSSPQTAPAVKSRVLGANERVNVAVIGVRSRGFKLARSFAELPDARVKTLVDVDENLFAERVKKVEEIQGSAPSTEYDLRRTLDDKDIDAVVVVTPDHWHALTTIWACQAGKHVYVEKPCCHNIWEGRKMVEAARKYNCIVTVGMQSRSMEEVRAGMKFLHEGGIGEVYMARGLCFKPRGSIGTYPDGPMPAGTGEINIGFGKMPAFTADYLKDVHYDLWLGCTPKRPFNANRFHYNWHWLWDYGCGDIGNQGPHEVDVARWGLNENEHPVKIHSAGGYFAFDSDQQTPNTQAATFEYADGKILQFEVRGLYTNAEQDIRIGNLFYGTEGWMEMGPADWGQGTWKTYFGRKNKPGPSTETYEKKEEKYDAMDLSGTGEMPHIRNFIHALRSGNKNDLTCDIELGYTSNVLPHLANISHRLGRSLQFDGKKEKFVGDKEANGMLTRKYRKPYVVPDRV